MPGTLYHIDRIESQQPGVATLECLEGNQPTTYTLRNVDTNEVIQITACTPAPFSDPCEVLDILHDAGYEVDDWNALCNT